MRMKNQLFHGRMLTPGWVFMDVTGSHVGFRLAPTQCLPLLLLRKWQPAIWSAWPGPLACDLSFHWHHYLPRTQGHLLHQPKGAVLYLGNHCWACNPVFSTYSVARWGHTLPSKWAVFLRFFKSLHLLLQSAVLFVSVVTNWKALLMELRHSGRWCFWEPVWVPGVVTAAGLAIVSRPIQ